MKINTIIAVLVLGHFLFGPSPIFAQIDDGIGADGIAVICSKTLAMRCGLSSHDAGDIQKIKECFDKIASDLYGSQIYKQSVIDTRDKVLHECSKLYYEQAVKTKADAGDYVDQGDAKGYSDAKTDKHGKKELEGKITANNAKNIVTIMGLYSSIITLDTLEILFGNLSNREISEEMKLNGEENLEIENSQTNKGEKQ